MARKGELRDLQAMAKYNRKGLFEADELGWTPFHEGARSGNLDVIKFFLSVGADMNLQTDAGISPLWIARHYLGTKHEVAEYLHGLGAVATAPRPTRPEEEEKDEL